MDAGIVGALIGIGIMAGCSLFYYLYDLYSKKHITKESKITVVVFQNPTISSETPSVLVRTPSHKKLKEFLPPSL